jgi:pimeloyl-ACP methyl ester carboxylesterase
VNTATRVVLVHGLFYGRWSMRVLAGRLRRAGFSVESFGYRPMRDGLEGAAAALAAFCRGFDSPVTRFVGHSLGGLVILRALDRQPERVPGRAVLLGTPLQGSQVAQRLCASRFGRAMLGAAGPALVRGYSRLPPQDEIGVVAGTVRLGLGRLTGVLDGPSDGTVGVQEANATGLAGRLVLPVTHTGMLFSARVAGQAAHFLRAGRFDPSLDGPG